MLAARTAGGVVSIRLTTGGSGYSTPPTVTLTGGGGSGAAAVAYMAGTRVARVEVVSAGLGYTSDPTVNIAGNAEATAHAYTHSFRPLKLLKARDGTLIGVDGMGRGIRWNGQESSASPLGLLPPQRKPAVTLGAGTGQFLTAIDITESGSGFYEPPAVTITGGNPDTPARARARVAGGRVTAIDITEAGGGYQSVPSVTLSGGNPSGGTFTVDAIGQVIGVEVTNSGSGYTATPTIGIATSNGLTEASFVAVTDGDKLLDIIVTAAGTGATTTPVLSVSGNASLKPLVQYSVRSVSVVHGGTGYQTEALLNFVPNALDINFTPASATVSAASGALQSVTVISGGAYSVPPTARIDFLEAKATPRLAHNALIGKYKCALRYLTTEPDGSRRPSSISDLLEVDAEGGASSLAWSLSHGYIDERVDEVELWRTSGDQDILLYRVASIPRSSFPGSFIDSIADKDLIDTDRAGYGLMPITMPSGQVNARKYGVLPGNYAVGVMFQDRAWFAVDTSGVKLNSLWFSEVDLPEAVPATNEIIVQESVGDSDEIITLVPLSSALLILQRRHAYRLQYVAQPVIDASITLAAYRGILNQNCVDIIGGVAYIADSNGIYTIDGSSTAPASVAIDNIFRDGDIDFTKSDMFFLKADSSEMVVRFFYCEQDDSEPRRALCYSIATQSWWKEEFAVALRSAGNNLDGVKQQNIYGTGDGRLATPSGYTDDGQPIPYSIKTGNFPLTEGGSRSIGVVYTPTPSTASLSLKLHYNGSSSSRPNAVQADLGGPFTATTEGGRLDMQLNESHLGESVGHAIARYSGRGSRSSSGADRHIAVKLSGSQSSAGDSPIIHQLFVDGAG